MFIFLLFHPLLIQPHEFVVFVFPGVEVGAHDQFFFKAIPDLEILPLWNDTRHAAVYRL